MFESQAFSLHLLGGEQAPVPWSSWPSSPPLSITCVRGMDPGQGPVQHHTPRCHRCRDAIRAQEVLAGSPTHLPCTCILCLLPQYLPVLALPCPGCESELRPGSRHVQLPQPTSLPRASLSLPSPISFPPLTPLSLSLSSLTF